MTPRVEVLWVDGTWAPSGGSMVSESVRHHLNSEVVRFTYVNYPASFGPATALDGLSYAESKAVGARRLLEAAHASELPVVLGGYSQGAAAAVDAARALASPSWRHLDVRGLALLGNPHQAAHAGRSGIANPLSVPMVAARVWSLYAAGDPIADLPDGSPLRSVADLTLWMSLRSFDAGVDWALDILEAMPTRWQRWWEPWRWPDIESAALYAKAYVDGNAHMRNYVYHGHTLRLARLIEGVAA